MKKLVGIILGVLITVGVAFGHGKHLPYSSGPIIGQMNGAYGTIVWLQDFNENGLIDWIRVLAFVTDPDNPEADPLMHILAEYHSCHEWNDYISKTHSERGQKLFLISEERCE